MEKELNDLTKDYGNIIMSLETTNLNLESLSGHYDESSLKQINFDFQLLKKKIILINERFKILKANKELTSNKEIKFLLKEVRLLYNQVQSKIKTISSKAEMLQGEKSPENKFDVLRISFDEKESNYQILNKITNLQQGNRQAKRCSAPETDNTEGSSLDTQGDLAAKKGEMERIGKCSGDIRQMAAAIQREINEQGNDLSRFESLIDEGEKVKLLGTEEFLEAQNISMMENSTNFGYLYAWCLGSAMLFMLMIILKYVLNTSQYV